METWLISVITGGVPVAVLLAFAFLRRRRMRARFKTPLTAKLLRSPGESLRQEIERLNEKLDDGLLQFLGLCFGIAVYAWFVPKTPASHPPGVLAVLCSVYGVFYAVCLFLGVRIFRVQRLKHDYELGFLGERAVGEELNRMLASGYEVFHDVVFEGSPGAKNFNIDHVVVGPGGAYAVETKTRRKQPKKGHDTPRNVVEFDGSRLHFPWGADDFGIKQARGNAGVLSTWLQNCVGTEVKVTPVLALPGWFVERKGRGDVSVVSGREIGSLFPKENSKSVLSPSQIKLIAFHLEQRCRNIEVE